MMTFTFTGTSGSEPVLYLTYSAYRVQTRDASAPDLPSRVWVSHGCRRVLSDLVPVLEEGHQLPASSAAVQRLGLVEGLPYRLKWVGGELVVGPVVGLHLAAKTKDMATGPHSSARLFFLRYGGVGGLAFAFATDGLNVSEGWVEGYYWKPEGSEPGPTASPGGDITTGGESWRRTRGLAERVVKRASSEGLPAETNRRTARFQAMGAEFLGRKAMEKTETTADSRVPILPDTTAGGHLAPGRFPLPAAVWRRCGRLPPDTLSALMEKTDGHVFNSDFFDKWEGFRRLSTNPSLRRHLPETAPLTNVDDLVARLAARHSIVLKQREGNSGYGMVLLEPDGDGDGCTARYRVGGRTEHFPSADSLKRKLGPLVTGRPYLVQEHIRLPSYKDRVVDFRVMMQKDHRGAWQPVVALGRFGSPGSIVTSFINNGYALPADEAMRRVFGLTWRGAFAFKCRLVDFCAEVCRALDESGGCYGDLGLDVGIDVEGHLWLFEANKLPFHELALYAGQEQAYLAVKSGPLLYASHLAGFPGES